MRHGLCSTDWLADVRRKKRRTMRVRGDTPHSNDVSPHDTPAHDGSTNGAEPHVVNAKLMGCGLGLLNQKVASAAAAGHFALTVGGDHSVAAGSISAMLKAHPDLCVVWVDAHADANTPATSPSMHYHGMPAAHLLGWFKSEVRALPLFRLCATRPHRVIDLNDCVITGGGLRMATAGMPRRVAAVFHRPARYRPRGRSDAARLERQRVHYARRR